MANEIAQEANQQRHWGILHVDKDSTMISTNSHNQFDQSHS